MHFAPLSTVSVRSLHRSHITTAARDFNAESAAPLPIAGTRNGKNIRKRHSAGLTAMLERNILATLSEN